MKKIFFVTTFLVAGIISQAQIKFGVKGALNLSSLSKDVKEAMESDFEANLDQKTKIGYAFGAFANIPVASSLSFQPELLYSLEGGKYSVSESGAKLTSNLDFGFVNIPLLLQYNNPSGFFAETGPQVGFLVSAKNKVKFEFDGDSDSDTEDIKDGLKSTNFSWALGAGYKLPSGLGFGLRYTLGLSNLNDDDEADDFKVKTNTFQIGVTYTFGNK